MIEAGKDNPHRYFSALYSLPQKERYSESALNGVALSGVLLYVFTFFARSSLQFIDEKLYMWNLSQLIITNYVLYVFALHRLYKHYQFSTGSNLNIVLALKILQSSVQISLSKLKTHYKIGHSLTRLILHTQFFKVIQ